MRLYTESYLSLSGLSDCPWRYCRGFESGKLPPTGRWTKSAQARRRSAETYLKPAGFLIAFGDFAADSILGVLGLANPQTVCNSYKSAAYRRLLSRMSIKLSRDSPRCGASSRGPALSQTYA